MAIESIIILVGAAYLVSLIAGSLMQKYLKIPWMFAALFFGIVLSALGWTAGIQSDSFQVLANLGLLIILFLIGFNLDLTEIIKLKRYVALGTVGIIIGEGLAVSLLLYFFFPAFVNNSFVVALVVATSFATVGEAVLLPILKEFKVLDTKFGQLTLGIGTFDDIIELATLVAVVLLPFAAAHSKALPSLEPVAYGIAAIIALSALFLLLRKVFLSVLKKSREAYVHFLVVISAFFVFVTASYLTFPELAPIAVIVAGALSRHCLPPKVLKDGARDIDFLGYVFFAPLFFLSVGGEVSLDALSLSPLLVLALVTVALGAKLLASFALFRKLLGTKYSLLMGVGLSVRFSTSLVVQYILLSEGLISAQLFSALIATAVILKPVIIGVYSWGLSKGRPP